MKVFNEASFSSFLSGLILTVDAKIGAGMLMMAENTYHHALPIFGDNEKLADLAPSTQEERTTLGFSANEPLLRSGELRGTLSVHSEGMTAGFGSSDMRMLWLDQGNAHYPPRPLLEISVKDAEASNKAILLTITGNIFGNIL